MDLRERTGVTKLSKLQASCMAWRMADSLVEGIRHGQVFLHTSFMSIFHAKSSGY